MTGLICGMTALWLHAWWCCRTANSPAVKRSWPYPRSWKNSADLYERPCRRRRHLRARTQLSARSRRGIAGRTPVLVAQVTENAYVGPSGFFR
ncbi:MAG: hypothetical protein VYE46_04510 [Cyanobacteriota bacterium]|nr:hypothetical protein [Cyanobacteriota bacterium]